MLTLWGFSSAGRASALHAEGQEFESPNLQILKLKRTLTALQVGSFLYIALNRGYFLLSFIMPANKKPYVFSIKK